MRLPRLQKRIIACCACGAHFRSGQLSAMEMHITDFSSPSHRWTFVRDIKIITN